MTRAFLTALDVLNRVCFAVLVMEKGPGLTIPMTHVYCFYLLFLLLLHLGLVYVHLQLWICSGGVGLS